MKKLFLFVLLYSNTWVYAQQKECTIDEYVLLKEKPDDISDREALKVIRGEKEKTITDVTHTYKNSTVIPPRLMKQTYGRYLYLRKTGNLPEWRQTVSVEIGGPVSDLDDGIIVGWIIAFLISFALGTAFLNYCGIEFSRNIFRWVTVGSFVSILFGFGVYCIYQGMVNTQSSRVFEFSIGRYISFVVVSIVGGLIYGIYLFFFDDGHEYREQLKKKFSFPFKKTSFS